MQKGHNKVPKRSYRLSQDLEDQWAEYLEGNGLSHNQEIKKAISAYLFQYYPQTQQGN